MSELRNQAASYLATGEFSWNSTPILVRPAVRTDDPCDSIKDPSVVRHGGRWHIFASIRSQIRSHQIEYLSFERWEQADSATRHVLSISAGFFCAPQIFFFEPHNVWFLLYQVVDETRKPALQPAFSTTTDIGDPSSWSAPTPLFTKDPAGVEMWLDFWIICDDQNAHFLFTSLNGKMWHAQTSLSAFPHGWSTPTVVLEGDVYEASHTYKLKGRDQYLTVIEAVGDDRRYFKAYTAGSLSDRWQPLADSIEKALAAPANVSFDGEPWTTSFSHGEFLRTGTNELLEIDPDNLKLLYQGVADADREGVKYGKIPWKLGLLE